MLSFRLLLTYKQPTEMQRKQNVKLVAKRAIIAIRKMRHVIQSPTTIQIPMMILQATAVIVSIAMTVDADVIVVADVIAIAIVETVKNANQYFQKMTFYFQWAVF
jgi:hypothetical protein